MPFQPGYSPLEQRIEHLEREWVRFGQSGRNANQQAQGAGGSGPVVVAASSIAATGVLAGDVEGPEGGTVVVGIESVPLSGAPAAGDDHFFLRYDLASQQFVYSGAVMLAPDAVDRNLIQTTNDAYRGLLIKGFSATQSAPLLEVQASDGRSLFKTDQDSGIATHQFKTVKTNVETILVTSAPGGTGGVLDLQNLDGSGEIFSEIFFGTSGDIEFYQQSSNIFVAPLSASLSATPADATAATFKGRLTLFVGDWNGNKEVLRGEADGTNPRIGFLGAPAVVRPAATDDLRQALINLGLYTTGGASPLNLNGGTLAAGQVTTGASFTAQSTGEIDANGSAGSAGNYLQSGGAGASASWAAFPASFSGDVTLTPGSSTRNKIIPTGDFIPLTAQGSVGQTQPLFLAQDSGALAIFEVASTGSSRVVLADATTAFPGTILLLSHNSSGTPAANFGGILEMAAKSSTSVNQSQFKISSVWVDATHATRKARTQFYIFDTTGYEAMRMEASGAAMIGFLGAAAVVRPAATDDLRQALINLGLYTTGGASPLNLNGGSITASGSGNSLGATTFTGDVTLSTHNLITDTTTGTKIGTGSTQKLGFFGATPVVRPASTDDLRQALINLGLYTTGGATPLNLNGGVFTTTASGNAMGSTTHTGDVTLSTHDLITDTTTGTKIGTATTQKLGFWNHAPAARPSAYTVTNPTTNRSLNETTATLTLVAQVLGTLIQDLQSVGLVG